MVHKSGSEMRASPSLSPLFVALALTMPLVACSGAPDGALPGDPGTMSPPPSKGTPHNPSHTPKKSPKGSTPSKKGSTPPAADGGAPPADAGSGDSGADAVGATIASIAQANVGLGACSTNSEGGTAYETSCDGNYGQPEYWCADFAQWVWQEAGVDTTGLDAAAGSFYLYGQANGTFHTTPAVGDAAVFNYSGGGVAEHVAIVVDVQPDGTIETVSGDWNGTGSTEAEFSSTSQVVLNVPAYPGVIGSSPGTMGMAISAFVSPAKGSGGTGGAPTCTVASTGEVGTCIDTGTCASMGGTSTPGYCPGPASEECCTGL